MPSCCLATPAINVRLSDDGVWRRGMQAIKWLAPTAVLALLPKCPMCLAGYVLIVSGVGLTPQGAAHMQALIVALCVLALGLRGLRQGLRMHHAR